MQPLSVFEQHLSRPHHNTYKPVLFRINREDEQQKLHKILKNNTGIEIHDRITAQIRELVKIQNPSKKLSEEDYHIGIIQYLKNKHCDFIGNWCYYPWSRKLVHILPEQDFVEARTSRNRYKITDKEQEQLQKKKIGIIGLSVGQSIALTLVMERVCGEIRLADFDEVELTNLNRIRTGVHNLGIKKVIVAAREIAEIDPYIKVEIYEEGITAKNIADFLNGAGKLDLLVEECDGIDVKITSRLKARELKIPVVMDTNDRGMLDIERFDLEPERPLFHGKLPQVDEKKLPYLSNEEKMELLDAMVGFQNLSDKMKISMAEIGKTLTTWPQLASSVVLGGAMVTDTCRRILLGELSVSGRYNVDFETIIH